MKAEMIQNMEVLVCGGGPAGVAAALLAARSGARTLLVERCGRLGGAGVVNLVQPLMGGVFSPLVEEIRRRWADRGSDAETLDLLYADLLEEAGAVILLHSWAADVTMDGPRLTGVKFLNKQGVLEVRATVTIDATGDGDVAFRTGAAFEKGRPGDGKLQPMSIMFRLGGVDKTTGLLCGSEEQAAVHRVPEGVWHDVVGRGQASGELPPSVGIVRLYESPRPGERVVNATQVNGVDGTNASDLTRAELEGRRQAIQILDFLRRHAPGYENCWIAGMPEAIGVRETRRFLGVEYLTRQDIVAGRQWDTAIVKNASFPIDIHNPDGSGQAEGFAAAVKPYDIPYGCLVPRVVEGLLLAGRCISGSHDAHASYRVQWIAMGIGAAAGAAAAEAVATGVAPRQVAVRAIRKRLGLVAADELPVSA